MKSILLVDGYNVIGAWEYAEKHQWPIDECRDRLAHMLEDYAATTKQYVILVFDGYKNDSTQNSIEKREHIEIVFTKKDVTADHYIETTVYKLPVYVKASVATSDALQQANVLGNGATRISSREMLNILKNYKKFNNSLIRNTQNLRETIAQRLPEELFNKLEEIRRSDK